MKLSFTSNVTIATTTYRRGAFLILLVIFACFPFDFVHAQEVIQEVDSTLTKQQSKADSLYQQAEEGVKLQQSKVDSMHQKAEGVINTVNTPIDKVTQKTDSIAEFLEIDQKINAEIGEKKNQLENTVKDQKQIQETSQALGNIQNETGLDVSPELQGTIPKLELPNQNLGIPTQELPQKLSLPKVEVQKMEGLGKVAGKVGDIREVSGKVGAYKGDIEAISKGKVSEVKELPKLGEQKLKGTKEIQALQGQSQQMEEFKQQKGVMKGQVEQYKDKNYLKNQAKQKVVEKAVDHFALRSKELQSAQMEIAKLKRKYSSFNTQTGEFVKRASLKDRPFYEHITWGTILEVHQGPPVAFDVSPFVGYRFNKLWTWSVSGTYRFTFTSDKRFTFAQPVYGGRTFVERDVFKKLFVHAEAEWLNTTVPRNIQTDEVDRKWVKGLFIGTGKTYNITKKIKGNVLLQYNLTYSEGTPYLTRWNTRMGFIFH